MKCPKCKTTMRGEVLAGRQVAGSSRDIRISGMTCWCCGNWFDVEVPTVRRAEVDEKPVKRQEYNGGRKPGEGMPTRVAIQVVHECFDLIANHRRARSSWQRIADLVGQKIGQSISWMTVQKHYEQEVLRRLDQRAEQKRSARSSRRLNREAAA